MKKKFLLVGNDLRQYYLKEMLEQRGNYVELIEKPETADVGKYDVILLPVSDSMQYYHQFSEKLRSGQYVFGCNLPHKQDGGFAAAEAGQEAKLIEYMKQDSVAYKNAVATAEGAIAEAIVHSGVNLCAGRSLVLGYGRCGKVLADRLSRMYSTVTVAERKKETRAEAETLGLKTVGFPVLPHLQREGRQYAYVFNTVPSMVLSQRELSLFNRNVTIIDIASKPGGVDYDYCKKHQMNAVHALGLPGKYAPKASAGILLQVIEENMV